jgi:type I restriction enzyme S subunit
MTSARHSQLSIVNSPLPPGYKQTEVGVIPKEWDVVPFQEATHLITCGLAATPTYVPESMGKPFLSAQNVRNGRVVFDNHKFISPELFEQITRHNKPRRGDLLYTRVGAGIGEAGIVESDVEFGIYVSLTLIKTDSRKLHNGFATYLLNSPRYRTLAKNGQFAGGGVQNLNVEVVRQFSIPLPSLDEQRAIATALSDVDALLGALDRLIAKKRDLKQAAMQQLLTGQTRIPGFHGEWEVKRLGCMGTFLKGSGVKKDEAMSGDLPCVRYGELYTHHNDVVRVFNSRVSPLVAVGATPLRKGDILFAGSGETKEEIGKSVAFVHDCEAYAGGDIVILRPDASDADFLGYYLNSVPIQKQKASRGQGDAVVHISAASLAAIELAMPSVPEQTAIAAALTEMDAELEVLEQRLAKTRALKQGVMQELLTGRTRLIESGN